MRFKESKQAYRVGTKGVIKYECVDDYLDHTSFLRISEVFERNDVAWNFFGGTAELDDDPKQFLFKHEIHQNNEWISPLAIFLNPLLAKIGVMAIHRIRVNLLTRSEKNIESRYHNDYEVDVPDKIDLWSTSIYYLNDCDGYTKLEDGTVIKSKANRLLTFPANVNHLGASCTDKKRRMVINLNYIK